MKAGTTALYDALRQHPDVFMAPVKEPNYFAFADAPPAFTAPIDERPEGINNASITAADAYRALFDGSEDAAARGEASHWYLYWPAAPANIQEAVPTVRLLAVLRNPVERAYSEFMHFVRDGVEPITDFGKALDAEGARVEAGWALGRYVDRGRYAEQLERYLARFDRSQLRIYLHDDLVEDPQEVIEDVYRFIGVDPHFSPATTRRVNKSGVPKRRWMHRLLTAAQPMREALAPVVPQAMVRWATALKNQNLDKPPMDPAVRSRLIETFRPEVRALETLLDRDLSHWLAPTPRDDT